MQAHCLHFGNANVQLILKIPNQKTQLTHNQNTNTYSCLYAWLANNNLTGHYIMQNNFIILIIL